MSAIEGIFGTSAVALAFAALLNAISYALRRKADASAQLVQSLLDRVRHLEARVLTLEASLRASEMRGNALVDENEELRDSIATGRVIPTRSRRDDTGRHGAAPGSLTASIAEEGGGR